MEIFNSIKIVVGSVDGIFDGMITFYFEIYSNSFVYAWFTYTVDDGKDLNVIHRELAIQLLLPQFHSPVKTGLVMNCHRPRYYTFSNSLMKDFITFQETAQIVFCGKDGSQCT